MRSHSIFNVRIDDVTRAELTARFLRWLDEPRQKMVVTPNPEMLLMARKDRVFLERLNRAHLALPDGVGLRYAVAALTDEYLYHRHTGVDAIELIAQACEQTGKSMLLFGGDPGAAQASARELKSRFERLKIDAIDPGMVAWDGNVVELPKGVRAVMERLEPNVLIVALGQGKQEAFMEQELASLPSVSFAIGVGGAFEMLSHQKRRSPLWMRQTGLEFLWRLLIEPRRAGRIIRASIVFPALVALATIQQGRFIKALKRVFPEIYRQLIHR